jgi:hypothetical protein
MNSLCQGRSRRGAGGRRPAGSPSLGARAGSCGRRSGTGGSPIWTAPPARRARTGQVALRANGREPRTPTADGILWRCPLSFPSPCASHYCTLPKTARACSEDRKAFLRGPAASGTGARRRGEGGGRVNPAAPLKGIARRARSRRRARAGRAGCGQQRARRRDPRERRICVQARLSTSQQRRPGVGGMQPGRGAASACVPTATPRRWETVRPPRVARAFRGPRPAARRRLRQRGRQCAPPPASPYDCWRGAAASHPGSASLRRR